MLEYRLSNRYIYHFTMRFCTLPHSSYTIFSPYLSFSVDLGSFSAVTSVTEKVVNEGEQVRLECNAPKSEPPALITWGLQEESEDTSSIPRPLSLDKRIQTSADGTFQLQPTNL